MQRQLSYHQMQQQIDKVYQHHYPNHVHKTVSRCYEGHRQNPRTYAMTNNNAGCLCKSQPRFAFYFHVIFFPLRYCKFLNICYICSVYSTVPQRGLSTGRKCFETQKAPRSISNAPRRFRKRNNILFYFVSLFSFFLRQSAKPPNAESVSIKRLKSMLS